MRKKILAFVFAAALLVAIAVPLFSGVGTVSADPGGVPNINSCFGRANSPGAKELGRGYGEIISGQAQAGERADNIAAFKAGGC